ncbi:MAG TPA: NADH-quinone oxidoreductase subunit N [Actinomycetota bacterium]|nr:NADH-quinone oxidoreductase subunit N [Actinomycetota bacterium]
MSPIDLHAALPEIILTAALLLVLTIDLFLPDERKKWNSLIAMLGVMGSLVALGTLVGERKTTFAGMFVIDGYALLFKFLFLTVAAIVILISIDYLDDNTRNAQGEFYFLLLSSFLGMLLMASARDLVMLFVALELVSAPGFLVAGFRKRDARSNEAAIKFFLFGVLSTAIMLFGMSLIYGVTRATNLTEIANALQNTPDDPLVVASILLIVAGFGFKVSAVPFHFWAPDTYEGSPIPVAAFLSVASKAAGFAGLLSLMFVGFVHQTGSWAPGFAIMAVLTMTIGNVVAMQQSNIVRLLAYSSIAQAGYILLPFAVVDGAGPVVLREAFAAALTYILIYSFMNIGAFAVVIAVARKQPSNLISDYDGLAQREPGLAAAMLFFLLSLAGIPPLAGFWAKFFVFSAAIDADSAWIAAVMVVNSVIGLYYYLSVGSRMYLRPASDSSPLGVSYPVAVAIALALIVVVAVGIFPDFFNHFSPRSTLVAG